jgi:hypothetical protein
LILLLGFAVVRAADSPQASLQSALRTATAKGRDSFGQWVEVVARPAWLLVSEPGQHPQPIDMSIGSAVDALSSIKLSLEWHEAGNEILAALAPIAESTWKPLPDWVGFSRVAIRIRSERGDLILNMFVNPTESALLFEGRWYEVDGKLLNRLLDIVESLTVELLRGSREKQTVELIQRRRERKNRAPLESGPP